jgi:hypothetical protein
MILSNNSFDISFVNNSGDLGFSQCTAKGFLRLNAVAHTPPLKTKDLIIGTSATA